MVSISSFGRILKSEGLGIKSIAQKVYQDKAGASFLVNLNNGSKGIYNVSKETGQLKQTLSSGNKTVEYLTKKSNYDMVDVFSKKTGEYVTIPKTQSLAFVKENGQITSASNLKRTPVAVRSYKDQQTGQIRTQVRGTQEFHNDKFVNHFVLPDDVLIGANGQRFPIFERPMKGNVQPSLDVWKM